MTDIPDPITDEQLDAYLDGLLTPEESEAFELRLRDDPEMKRKVEQQEQIDIALVRLFPPEQAPDHDRFQEIAQATLAAREDSSLIELHRDHPPRGWTRKTQAALVGLAAALAWILVARQLPQPDETPYFQPKPVTVVYQEVVDHGFEPYYECRDDDRFAATFLRRQGQALSLAALPSGSEMLGLSYAGGLSRDTTAMLCRVDEQPVMVFVDRLDKDSPTAAENHAGKLKVHRVARDGLVFYEVTPFESPRMIDYLMPRAGDAS